MIVVDDRLSLLALAGELDLGDSVATTWSFHYRLTRALAARDRSGALSRGASDEARRLVADPPEARLRVLDPRLITEEAARLATQYDLNLLASELMASALRYGSVVRLSSTNVGRHWPSVMASEGISWAVM